MAFPTGLLQPTGLRHGIRHCPGGDDEMPCLNLGFGGKLYYVDPVNGNDAYGGLMPYPIAAQLKGPWQTLTHAFSAASPLGVASANVKGAYHDYLVMLPGTYEALETSWPITVPATKNSVHVLGSPMPFVDSPIIGRYSGAYTVAHATEPTLLVQGKDFSIEGVKICGPEGNFPVIRLEGDHAVLRYLWVRGRTDGGDGLLIAPGSWMNLIENSEIQGYNDAEDAILVQEESSIIRNNLIHASGGGICLAYVAPDGGLESDWTKILWNIISNRMGTYIMDYGIHISENVVQLIIDENRIGKATAGTSGVQRRIYDLSNHASNFFGRNWQLGNYQAGPPTAINRAGDPITDGGVGSGYATD